MNTSASYISAAAQFSPGASMSDVIQSMLNPVIHKPNISVRKITEDMGCSYPPRIKGNETHRMQLLDARVARYKHISGLGPLTCLALMQMDETKHLADKIIREQLNRLTDSGHVLRDRNAQGAITYEWVEK